MKQRKLTAKQEAFALAFIETGNASEAYRRAYNASHMKPEAIHVNASKMMAKANVALRVSDLRSRAEERAELTLLQHMDELKSLRESAKKDGMWVAAIKAEELRGRLMGYYVERSEVTVRSHEEALAALEQEAHADGTRVH